MISGHVWIGISNEMPHESMARLVYPIRYQIKKHCLQTQHRIHTSWLSVSFFFVYGCGEKRD